MCDVTFVPSLRKIILLLQDHCLKKTHRHTDTDTLSLQDLKNFSYAYSFYTVEEYLSQS
jgi:hypothetical protein